MTAEGTDFIIYREAMIILATAAVLVPIGQRFKLSPILGFLIAGAVLGPHGLGALKGIIPPLEWVTVSEERGLGAMAELGVVFLLFIIGLELSFKRLLTMRRLVFGLGTLQVAISAVIIGVDRGAVWRPRRCRRAHRPVTGAVLHRRRHRGAVARRPAEQRHGAHLLRHPAAAGSGGRPAAVPRQHSRSRERRQPARRPGAGLRPGGARHRADRAGGHGAAAADVPLRCRRRLDRAVRRRGAVRRRRQRPRHGRRRLVDGVGRLRRRTAARRDRVSPRHRGDDRTRSRGCCSACSSSPSA